MTSVSDWSFITGGGGLQKGRGGGAVSKVLPLQKGRTQQVLAMLKRLGHNKF